MSRKSFLLRIDETILEAVRRMADDELRSLNGQIEYLLRSALQQHKRLPEKPSADTAVPGSSDADPESG